MSNNSVDIPREILQFNSKPRCKDPTTSRSAERRSVLDLYRELKRNQTQVTGGVANWLRVQITNEKIPHVIRLLHELEDRQS
ncbi:MAG: hypothetical protein V4686_01875 [Patescibacteria group bacterium]